jgi:TrmH family RNA methyltransferase
MLSKNKIKFIQSLKLKKYRQKYNNFLAEGDKIIRSFLEMGHEPEAIYCQQDWWDMYRMEFLSISDKVYIVEKEQLKQISLLSSPPPVAGLFHLKVFLEMTEIKSGIHFYLDGIQDPGNLGTIIRTLDWFGEKRLYLSKDCVDPFNPKAVQASMGSVLNLDFLEEDLQNLTSHYTIYGTSMEGHSYYDVDFKIPALIVLGNEGQGIRPEQRAFVESDISIPGNPNSQVDSLNAAVSLAIICAHLNTRAV